MAKKEKKKKAPPEKIPTLPFSREKSNGKIEGVSTVVYSFTLPKLSGEEFEDCHALLSKLKEAFLLFLEKESKKEREGVYLGTLSFQAEENILTLLSSFSPFEEKEERPVARFLLSPTGKLERILKK